MNKLIATVAAVAAAPIQVTENGKPKTLYLTDGGSASGSSM